MRVLQEPALRSRCLEPEQWNGGAYLATALGHCGECHTPRNVGFGLEHGHELAARNYRVGALYNITSDSKYGIGNWSDADIVRLPHDRARLRACVRVGPHGGGRFAQLAVLASADAAALVAYLRTIPAHEGKHPWKWIPSRRRS